MATPAIRILRRKMAGSVFSNTAWRLLFVTFVTMLFGAAPPVEKHRRDLEPFTPVIPKDLPVRNRPRLTLADPGTDSLVGFKYLDKGRTLVGGTWNHRLVFWDARTGKVKAELKDKGCLIYASSPDGKLFANGCGDGTDIRLRDASTLKTVATLEGHKGVIIQLKFLPDNRRLLSLGRDGTARMWDIRTRKQIYSIQWEHVNVFFPVYDLSPDSTVLATGHDSNLTLWDARTGKKLREVVAYPVFVVHKISFSPDGTHLACHDNLLSGACVWRVSDLRKVGSPPEYEGFSPSIGTMLRGDRMVARYAKTMLIWNYKTRQIEARLDAHRSRLLGSKLLVSGDGKRMVSVDYDGEGYVWDTKTWSPLLKLSGLECDPGNPVLSPDDQSLAYAADRAGVAFIYDITLPARKPVPRPK